VVLVGLRRRPTRTFTGLARRSAQGQLSTVVIIEAGDRLESLEGAESDLCKVQIVGENGIGARSERVSEAITCIEWRESCTLLAART
jgi:hypothetical protein